MKRKAVQERVRLFVFERDSYHCRYCGSPLDASTAQIDHYIPVVFGGGNEPSNLRTSCAACNAAKGSYLPDGPNPYQATTDAIIAEALVRQRCPAHAIGTSQVSFWFEDGPRPFTLAHCGTQGCPYFLKVFDSNGRDSVLADISEVPETERRRYA